MVQVKSENGKVDVLALEGNTERIIADVGAIVHIVLLLEANAGSTSAEEVFIKYGMLARNIIDYIETTVKRVDEIGK